MKTANAGICTVIMMVLVLQMSSIDSMAQEESLQANSRLWKYYQKTLGQSDGDRCPMSPSCSAYAEQAIRKHGWLMGWVMTFDRFGHEGTEAQRTAHGVRFRNGKLVAIDEVEHNDYWWSTGARVDIDSLISSGRQELTSSILKHPLQLEGISESNMRDAGRTFLQIGYYQKAVVIFMALWVRNKEPTDAFYAAYAMLEDDQSAACVAFMEEVLNGGNNRDDDKMIAAFVQGLAFRQRGLYDAAVDAFARSITFSRDNNAINVIRSYAIEAQFKANKWNDAAHGIDTLDTPTALSIRREMTDNLPWRSPLISGALSAVLPGSGQVYCGRYQEGLWAFVVVGVFAFASYEAFEHDLEWVGAATTLTGMSWYLGNIYGATSAAHKFNQREKNRRIANWIERLGVQQDNRTLKAMLKFDF